MSPNKQKTFSCATWGVATTAFFALHFVALHTASAQTLMPQTSVPAQFVAPPADVVPVAAPSVSPAPVAAVATAPQGGINLVKPGAAAHPASAAAPEVIKSQAGASQATCRAPATFAHFDRPLPHLMRRLARGLPVTIVAIGSSSTAGAGASSVAANYPNQLAADLRETFPGRDITVLNRGVNGEETDNMMARFAKDVIAAHPQLVIWQVGTNSVLRDRSLEEHAEQLHEGIAELKAIDADVVLMDLQYSPAVIAKSETDGMVDQIALAAKTENVDLFERFAIMRDWSTAQHMSFDTFVSPDHLHMNDWGYGCVAKLLAGAIADAATRPVATSAAASSH